MTASNDCSVLSFDPIATELHALLAVGFKYGSLYAFTMHNVTRDTTKFYCQLPRLTMILGPEQQLVCSAV